eukprot:GEMP01034109.1.p1 GENE.GEMP01034109.1~~GEMP01034109.1.p1  ORF type:complete len:278 (+),score=40.91 GEMP01034109.1:22-834(+)
MSTITREESNLDNVASFSVDAGTVANAVVGSLQNHHIANELAVTRQLLELDLHDSARVIHGLAGDEEPTADGSDIFFLNRRDSASASEDSLNPSRDEDAQFALSTSLECDSSGTADALAPKRCATDASTTSDVERSDSLGFVSAYYTPVQPQSSGNTLLDDFSEDDMHLYPLRYKAVDYTGEHELDPSRTCQELGYMAISVGDMVCATDDPPLSAHPGNTCEEHGYVFGVNWTTKVVGWVPFSYLEEDQSRHPCNDLRPVNSRVTFHQVL